MKRKGVEQVDDQETPIDRLPFDLLAHIFALLTCFKDLAQLILFLYFFFLIPCIYPFVSVSSCVYFVILVCRTSAVSRKWREGVKESLARRQILSFSGWKVDDDSTTRLVLLAYSLKELDISRSRWGCQITDRGLYQLSTATCISNLSSLSLWGTTGITDTGVVQLISRASSLQHLNIGGTFITDISLFAIAGSCPHLKTIVLWGCRHVTENGLLALVNKCRKLESINAWGMRVTVDCFIGLLTISPALQIQPKGMLPNIAVF